MSELWDRKYKPKQEKDMVLMPNFRKLLKKMIKDQDVGTSKLFYGPPGIGKSLIGEILLRKIDCDYLIMNGSDETGVENLRKNVLPFMKTMPMTKNRKILIIDEADRLSTNSLDLLKSEQENNKDNCAILFMTNHIERFPEANLSRFGGGISLLPADKKGIARMKKMFYDRALFILESEKVNYDVVEKKKGDKVVKIAPVIQKIINQNYPDFRKTILSLQDSYQEYGEINENALQKNKIVSNKIINALKEKVKPGEMLKISSETDPMGFLYSFQKEFPKQLHEDSISEAYQIFSFYNSSMGKSISSDGHLGAFTLELLSANLKFKD
jgi:DNA polymerase III delta prime subunit